MRHVAALILISLLPSAGEPEAAAPRPEVRGMTVAAQRAGQSWGTDAMVETMRQLRDLGVNWVAIHPYGGIGGDGTAGSSRLMAEGRDLTWLTRPIAEAHRLGLRIMIKPHLAYWHSPFPWRGAIEFETDEAWDRFFTTYEAWVGELARICADADAFVVGTELDRTVAHEDRWRSIIAQVRRHTDAPLTYAANWDAYQRVPFWDALDVIGVQAYFPLVEQEGLPDPRELEASWRRIAADLDAFGRRHGRKVVLSEFGYERSVDTALRPWETRRRLEPNAEEVQRRCMEAALAALKGSDQIVGGFLWKWFPGESERGSHIMSTRAMRDVIAAHWGAP